MANSNSKVIVLADYRKGNAVLNNANVKGFIESEREAIRKFDGEVYDLLREKHKIRVAEYCHDRVLEHEQALLAVSDWLNDKQELADVSDKPEYEKLVKECEKLIERNERTKKNIVDDLAECRHYENKRELIKIIGFALLTPLTVFNLVKALAPSREDLAWAAGIAGVAIGSTVAFHDRAGEMFLRVSKAVVNSPRQIKKIGKVTRTSYVTAAFSMSVAAKKISEIESSIKPQELYRPNSVYLANKL